MKDQSLSASTQSMTDHKRNLPDSKLIEITRSFQAPVEEVFAAWSKPQLVKQWWGPNQYSAPTVKIDFRVGGKFTFAMQGPDKKIMWSSGDYEEIVVNKKIVSTDYFSDENGVMVSPQSVGMPGAWNDKLFVTVEFETVSKNETKIMLSHEGIPQEMYDDCVKGWTESIDKLQKLLEKN